MAQIICRTQGIEYRGGLQISVSEDHIKVTLAKLGSEAGKMNLIIYKNRDPEAYSQFAKTAEFMENIMKNKDRHNPGALTIEKIFE